MVDHNNHQIATKVAIQNPLAVQDAPASLVSLAVLIENSSKQENKASKDYKILFCNLIKSLGEIRLLMPPLYNLDPHYILVNTEKNEVKIVLSDSLFDQENTYIFSKREIILF